jgi:hypothetical protein
VAALIAGKPQAVSGNHNVITQRAVHG